MKKFILILFLLLLPNIASAGCDDPLGDGVDYSKCSFADGTDLEGQFLANSNLSFAKLVQVNLSKSIMMNSNLSFGTFPESNLASLVVIHVALAA